MSNKRKRHTPEQIVWKLRDSDAKLSRGKSLGILLIASAASVPPATGI